MHGRVTDMLDSLQRVVDLIDEHAHDAFMTIENAKALRDAIVMFLMTYSIITSDADEAGDLLWNMAPKFHWLWHLGQRALFLSPRRGACWIDETFMKRMKRVASASAAGTALHRVPARVMDKYRWGRHALRLF